MSGYRLAVLVVWLLGAVWQDLRTRKIRNSYNVLGAAAGLILAFADPGISMRTALAGMAFGMAAGLLLWLLGMFHGGDAKLLWGIGAFEGGMGLADSLTMALLAGGMMAFFITVGKRDFKQRLGRLAASLKKLCYTGKFEVYRSKKPEEFPFSVPLAAGGILGVFIHIW